MERDKLGEWYQDEFVGGYWGKDGHLIVCEEYNLTDADNDRYAVEVQNREGYYNSNGKYVSFGLE